MSERVIFILKKCPDLIFHDYLPRQSQRDKPPAAALNWNTDWTDLIDQHGYFSLSVAIRYIRVIRVPFPY